MNEIRTELNQLQSRKHYRTVTTIVALEATEYLQLNMINRT
jgi:hypothetical protein